MFSLLKSFIDTVTTLITFVINSITSLFQLLVNIPKYTALVLNSINVLPSFILPFVIAFISLVGIQYVLNRR